jgi:hypothetical protein
VPLGDRGVRHGSVNKRPLQISETEFKTRTPNFSVCRILAESAPTRDQLARAQTPLLHDQSRFPVRSFAVEQRVSRVPGRSSKLPNSFFGYFSRGQLASLLKIHQTSLTSPSLMSQACVDRRRQKSPPKRQENTKPALVGSGTAII